MNRFTKIGEDGKPLPDDAEHWVIVLDNTTRLMWTVEETRRMTQEKALAAAAAPLTTGGFKDWRLPTVEELFLLADRTRYAPAIDTAHFPGCKSDWYWTSTPLASSPGACAWYVYFGDGLANWGRQGYEGFVRAHPDYQRGIQPIVDLAMVCGEMIASGLFNSGNRPLLEQVLEIAAKEMRRSATEMLRTLDQRKRQ